MDYDNDGILDLISGSYDPGDIYLFRGVGKGVYAKVETIIDKSGLPVVHHPVEFAKYERMKNDPAADADESIMARVASFGSWVAPVDWEADGDLDLLIGSFAGDLFLRLNEGSREKPAYGITSIPVEADGKPLHVNMHAAPVVADWNHDGLWDLVVGSGDGAVGWFANIGTGMEPAFGPYQPLVSPASDSKFLEQNLRSTDPPTHGVRAQICVTDYNHDGRLDLILGDYSDINWMRDLNQAGQNDWKALMDIQARMISRVAKLREALGRDQDDKQLKAQLEKLQQEFDRLEGKKKAFITSSGRASFIWLFLRKDLDSSEPVTHAASTENKSLADAAKSGRDPISMTVAIVPVKGIERRWQLSVELAIAPGWHIYSDVPAGAAEKTTIVYLELPRGVEVVGEWERPVGMRSLSDPSKKICSGTAEFRQELRVIELVTDAPIHIKVEYQACTDKFCLPPAVLQAAVVVPR